MTSPAQPLTPKTDVWDKVVLLYNKPSQGDVYHGIGDALQFSRYAMRLKDAGARRVILQAQTSTHKLLKTIDAIDQVIGMSDPAPDHDFHAPIFRQPSMAGWNKPNLEECAPFYFADSYIRPDPELIEEWAALLGPQKLPRVAVNWMASEKSGMMRSIDFDQFAIALVPGFEYISLRPRWDPLARGIRQFNTHVSLDDAAALCSLCQLTVSVDTGLMHLSAAMGCPTWGILPAQPDWRFGMDSDQSPWYPSLRLFRQRPGMLWIAPLAAVRDSLLALKELVMQAK